MENNLTQKITDLATRYTMFFWVYVALLGIAFFFFAISSSYGHDEALVLVVAAHLLYVTGVLWAGLALYQVKTEVSNLLLGGSKEGS